MTGESVQQGRFQIPAMPEELDLHHTARHQLNQFAAFRIGPALLIREHAATQPLQDQVSESF